MPYHSAAVEADWSDLDSNYQGLMLGFLKGLGGGAFVAGTGTVYMAIASFRGSVQPYAILLPIVSTGYSILLCYATYTVKTSTPGDPPLLLTVVYVAMGLVASALLIRSARAQAAGQKHPE